MEEKEEVQISGSETESVSEETEKQSPVDSAELKLREIITEGMLDFDGWTALIEVVEGTYPDDIEKICLVYESFLSEFPLCYCYWRKFADHKTRLCTIDKAVEVFEGAVQSATYSVDVWVDYCSFSVLAFEDPSDVRRLFKRGLSFVGKDYLCHTLWDKFIEFELSQQQWSSLAHIYIQTLRFPTKKLHRYYASFKKLVAIWEEEMECQSNSPNKLQSELMHDVEVPTCYKDDEIFSIIKDLLDPSIGSARSHALSKYLSVGEHFYQSACHLDKQICLFEAHIRRSYFHVKPLDACQLENWHQYLDFVESQGNFDWAVKLYERCLIPCSNYPEFWMRYVDFLETKGGREIANCALDRATQNFLKRVPAIYLFNSRFKEQIGDVSSARTAVIQCKAETDSGFVENVIGRANMEKRLGNYAAASNIYVEALETAAAKEKSQTLPLLYVHFSRLKLITGSADAARDTLINGIKQVSHCKLILEELIRLATIHDGVRDVNMINSVMTSTIFSEPGVSQGLSAEEREDISNLYLEFVDLCGSIHDVRNAWNRHMKRFPLSMRTTINFPTPAAPVNVGLEERKETFVAMFKQSSQNCNVECMILAEDKLPLPPENHDSQCNEAPAGQISDQKLENHDVQSDHGKIQPVDADEVSEQCKAVSEPRAQSPNLLQEVANERDSMQAARESELEGTPLSLDKLSFDAKDNESRNSIPTASHEYEAPQETCMSNGSMEGGRQTHQTYDSSQIQIRAASPSSSGNHQIPTTYQHDRNWHQMRYSNRYRRDTKFGIRGNSQKRQQQHRHISSQQQYPPMVTPVSQGGGPSLPMQNSQGEQFNQTSNQYQVNASAQNLQQPGGYPQSQMVQYPMEGNDQYAYNQMWQYYYYQQQQQQFFMQQQQQLLQQQQNEVDPQQQQLLQQQYQQQLQLQQQYMYQQQQQFQQLSEQQFQQQQQSAEPQQLDPQQQYLHFMQQQQYQLYLQQLQSSQQNQPLQVEQHEEELEQPSQPSQQQEQEKVQEQHDHRKFVSLQPHHDSNSQLEAEELRQHITSSQRPRVTPSDDTDTEISI